MRRRIQRTVRKGPEGGADIGGVTLAHFYYTTKFPLGLTAGPCLGISVTDTPRFLGGVGLVLNFSRRVRVLVSYGVAYGKRTVLNGDEVGETPNGDAVSTAEVYRKGEFGAVTFRFSF